MGARGCTSLCGMRSGASATSYPTYLQEEWHHGDCRMCSICWTWSGRNCLSDLSFHHHPNHVSCHLMHLMAGQPSKIKRLVECALPYVLLTRLRGMNIQCLNCLPTAVQQCLSQQRQTVLKVKVLGWWCAVQQFDFLNLKGTPT